MSRNCIFHIGIALFLVSGSWLSKPAIANPTWNIQTVDSTGNVGKYTSVALDAGGKAHISYSDKAAST